LSSRGLRISRHYNKENQSRNWSKWPLMVQVEKIKIESQLPKGVREELTSFL
jgi:hypothetical protein